MTDQSNNVLPDGIRQYMPVMRVAVVSFNGQSVTVPIAELLDTCTGDEEYAVQIKTMLVRDFEALPEFAGF